MCNCDILSSSPFCPVIVSDDDMCVTVMFYLSSPFCPVIISDDNTCFTMLFY